MVDMGLLFKILGMYVKGIMNITIQVHLECTIVCFHYTFINNCYFMFLFHNKKK